MNNLAFIASNHRDLTLAVVGLGYVGLPLAVEFAKNRKVVAYDLDKARIASLKHFDDRNGQISADEFGGADGLRLTDNSRDLSDCTCYIITVPTPINESKEPDLRPLISASKTVADMLSKGDLVIYESTVYPGCTEDECVPILEKYSGLKFNKDFFCGYSPERINPGDREHLIRDVVKVTSGSNSQVSLLVDDLYASIVVAGTYRASSIKVAEAAKVIENTQRDLNVALVNELAVIFNKIGIDTEAVLEAAKTKWNFIPFTPGLVGGHCIGVDPYYLTYKARNIGYNPEVILAGRRLNDGMASYVVSVLLEEITKRKMKLPETKILIMGVTFKENCSDLRNSKVIDIILELLENKCEIEIFDPLVNSDDLPPSYTSLLVSQPKKDCYDAVLIAVAHREFCEMKDTDFRSFIRGDGLIYDLKNVVSQDVSDLRL